MIGVASAAVGVVALTAGTYLAIYANQRLGDSNGHCHVGNVCDPTGLAAHSDAVSAANAATIAFVVGADRIDVARPRRLLIARPSGASHEARGHDAPACVATMRAG